MRRAAWTFLILAAFLAIQGGSAIAAPDEVTLEGTYHWRDNSGDLQAVFTPAGNDSWNVNFYFEFRDQPHTYTGTAKGSLSDGDLKGEVKNEGKNRTFTFEGTFKGGTFEGTHAEIEDGETFRTGTLTLSS